MKNFILGSLFVLLFFVGGFFAYRYGQKSMSPTPTPVMKISPTEHLIGGDKDEHGCLIGAGYSWCESKNKCLRTFEEGCPTADDEKNIKQALVNKHNWRADEISITISKNDGQYVSGGVRETNSEVGGGYFYAVKDNGEWKIVADGNGTISCESLSPYPNYPVSMISECYNETTGKTVQR